VLVGVTPRTEHRRIDEPEPLLDAVHPTHDASYLALISAMSEMTWSIYAPQVVAPAGAQIFDGCPSSKITSATAVPSAQQFSKSVACLTFEPWQSQREL